MSTAWLELLTAFCLATSGAVGAPPSLLPPATNEQIRTLEVAIGAKLPSDYEEFLLTSNGIKNYFPGYTHPGTEDLVRSVKSSVSKYGSYSKMLREGVLFADEIGFGVREEQVLMISAYDGNPGALNLVVDEKSPSYGQVVAYWPGDSVIYKSWSVYLGELMATKRTRKS